MRGLAEGERDAAIERKRKEDLEMSSVESEEKERKEAKSEAVTKQKHVEVKDDILTRPGNIDRSRVHKPTVQEVAMLEEPSTGKTTEMALREVEPAAAVVTETPTGEDSQAPQGKTASDVSAEACQTAAQPIEQASKRVSNFVPGVGSQR